MANFEFVTSDPVSCLKPGKSLQIRSRCMQGKNVQPNSRRSVRRRGKPGQEESTGGGCAIPTLSREQATGRENETQLAQHAAPAPQQPLLIRPNDLALVCFTDFQMGNEAKAHLLRAFAHNVCDRTLTPLDRCLDLNCIESESLKYLFADSAFSRSMLCTEYALRDRRTSRGDNTPSCETAFHLSKAVSQLQERIPRPNSHEDESMMYVVINLALVAMTFEDWCAAAAHLKGLQSITRMRGGMKFLEARPSLHFKLDRIDLIWALSVGKERFFSHPHVKWESVMSVPYTPLPDNLYGPPLYWNDHFATLFRDFQYVALRVNRNRLVFGRHNPAGFQWQLNSLQSRLFCLEGQLMNPIEELLRLALLALMTTTFRAPGYIISYRWIAAKVEDAYKESGIGSIPQCHALHVWTLMVAAFTVTGTSALWIRKAWQDTTGGSLWTEVRSHLQRIV
ncbi:hypothetical protein TI39_contig340g00021 [Zymoseptoria brevis]|uniref:Transcription factor domain-containing protein n=1 Tax=Zymoseptoria brevis TaxID=1047168 RepID=A0A0F4GSE2_9PEZI|nr:hypothetical protein TI39_contig340g00021 [Zymoseptoria brevis]